MSYSKTNWDENTGITSARLNNLETQHELAIVDARVESAEPLKVEIVSSLPSAGNQGRMVFNTADNRFYFDTGTAWNVAAVTNVGEENFTPGTSNQSISEGYHDGNGTVDGDSDLVSGNIKYGVTIFGVNGSFDPPPDSFDSNANVSTTSVSRDVGFPSGKSGIVTATGCAYRSGPGAARARPNVDGVEVASSNASDYDHTAAAAGARAGMSGTVEISQGGNNDEEIIGGSAVWKS